MSDPMMRLGSYTFGLSSAAYQEFQRSTEYMWPAQGRTGLDDALQSTGPGPDTITLPGVIFPEFQGGTGQLDKMRALAARQKPQTLIDGLGRVLGDWVITGIEERGSTFAQKGVARRQEFNMKLRRFQDDSVDLALGSSLTPVVAGVIAVPSLISSAQSVASSAAKGPASMLSSLTGSLSKLTGMAASLGSQASGVIGAVRSGMNAAKTLQNAGGDAGRLLASAKNLANIPSAMNGLLNISGSVSRSAGVASGLLSQAGIDLGGSGAPSDTILAVKDAMISVNKLNVLAVQVRTSAQSIIGKG